MGKIITFLRYSVDFVKYGEFRYILSSIRYILTGKTTRKTRYYRSSLGKFIVRKGSLDFQFANYAYEYNVKKFVYKELNKYDVFLDVGANIGTYCIIPALAGLRVYGWEPAHSNFEALKTNIELNNLQDRINIYPYALGAKKGSASFTVDTINTGASHLTEYEDKCEHIENPEFEDIEIVRFDDVKKEYKIGTDEKVIMKIDVEGMEIDVINGAEDFIKNQKNLLIIIETIHTGNDNIKNKLDSLGSFDYKEIDNLNLAAFKTN